MLRKSRFSVGLVLLFGINNLLWILAYRAKPGGGTPQTSGRAARHENVFPPAAERPAADNSEPAKHADNPQKPAPREGEDAIDPSSFDCPVVDSEGFLDTFFVERSGMTSEQSAQVNAAVKRAQDAFAEADHESFKVVKSTDERVVILLDKHPDLGAAARRDLENSLSQALPGAKSRLIRREILEAASLKTGAFGEYVRILDILPSGEGYKFQMRSAPLRENTAEQIERDRNFLDEDFYRSKTSHYMKEIPSWLPQVFDKARP